MMPVQPETGAKDDPAVMVKPRRLTLAGALAQRERTSAFIGSRIRVDAFELEVVEIGPYTDQDGSVVTFLARCTGDASRCPGERLETPWGTCRIIG